MATQTAELFQKVLFKEPYGQVFLNSTNKILSSKLIGFLKLDDVKKLRVSLVENVRKHKITSHLSDQTEMKVLSADVQAYLTEEVFPQLQQEGLKKVAVVLGQNVFAKATVEVVNTKAQESKAMQIQLFDSFESAVAWLS